MHMKNLLILILSCLVSGVNAQSYCEVDSVYTLFDRETGFKVIETRDDNIVTIGLGGLNGFTTVNWPSLMVTKLDKCGKVLWRGLYDSLNTCLNCAGVSGAWEQPDKSIVFSAFYLGHFKKLYKIDQHGQLLWVVRLSDSVKNDIPIGMHKLNTNRFLYIVNQYNSNIINGALYFVDSLGNIKQSIKFLDNTRMFTFCSRQDNSILVLGGKRPSTNSPIDSIWTLILDTNLEILNDKMIFPFTNQNTYYEFNSEGTSLLSYTTNSENDNLDLKNITFNGDIIKDTIYAGKYPVKGIIKPIENNKFILVDHPLRIFDNNLNIIWKEDTAFSIQRNSFDAILTKDSTMITVGNGPSRQVGIGNFVSDFWFGVKKLSVVWVKKVQILGFNVINQKFGSIQLISQISPATATNKTVIWSISDTSKATISQTGLLTAKANGTVTIITQTTDGSNLNASKIITITNQGVGLMEDDFGAKQIVIYPNPTLSHITIQQKDLIIEHVQLLAINGKVLRDYTIEADYDISSFPNGYYLLKIETDKGIVFKKLMITK